MLVKTPGTTGKTYEQPEVFDFANEKINGLKFSGNAVDKFRILGNRNCF